MDRNDETKRKRYHAQYPGIVENIEDDPKGDLLRVQVRVYEIFSDSVAVESLPWATYRLPAGARENEGIFVPVKVGDLVWVNFPFDGDTRRPEILGSLHYAPESKPNLPHEAWDGPEKFEHKRTGDETTPEAQEYHTNTVLSVNGILIQIMPDGALSVAQKESGSEIWVDKDGNVTLHSEANLWASAKENEKIIIEGDRVREISGESEVTIGGSSKIDISGDEERTIGGGQTVDISSDQAIQAGGNVEVQAGGNHSVEAGGNAESQAGGNISEQAGGNYERKSGGNAQVQSGGNYMNQAGGMIQLRGATIMLN